MQRLRREEAAQDCTARGTAHLHCPAAPAACFSCRTKRACRLPGHAVPERLFGVGCALNLMWGYKLFYGAYKMLSGAKAE